MPHGVLPGMIRKRVESRVTVRHRGGGSRDPHRQRARRYRLGQGQRRCTPRTWWRPTPTRPRTRPLSTHTRHAYGLRPRCPRLRNRPASSTARISRRVWSRPVRMCRRRSTMPPMKPPSGPRKAARQAADYTAPRVERAVAAAGPVREEAAARGAAALAALRGQVTTTGDQEAGPQARAAGPGGPARQEAGRGGHPGRRRLRRVEVVGQAGQPRLAGRAARRDRGVRRRAPPDVRGRHRSARSWTPRSRRRRPSRRPRRTTRTTADGSYVVSFAEIAVGREAFRLPAPQRCFT